MKELLKKWSKLEPSLCQVVTLDILSVEKDYQIYFDGFWYKVSGFTPSPLPLGLVQLALQEVIVARNWDYELRGWENAREALIYPHEVSALIKHKGDSLATALLKAYLECLEILAEKAIRLPPAIARF